MTPALAQELVGKDLKGFYQQNCARCHGSDGSAFRADGGKLHLLSDRLWVGGFSGLHFHGLAVFSGGQRIL